MLPKPQDLRTIKNEFRHGKSIRDLLESKKLDYLTIMVRVSDVENETHMVEDAFLQVGPLDREPPRNSYYVEGSASEINSGKIKDIHSPGGNFQFDPETVWDFVNHNMHAYLKGAHTYMHQRKP